MKKYYAIALIAIIAIIGCVSKTNEHLEQFHQRHVTLVVDRSDTSINSVTFDDIKVAVVSPEFRLFQMDFRVRKAAAADHDSVKQASIAGYYASDDFVYPPFVRDNALRKYYQQCHAITEFHDEHHTDNSSISVPFLKS